MHFGASKVQVTLHTGVIFFKGGQQSFCTFSPSNIHEPHAIWAQLMPIIYLGKPLVHNNLKKSGYGKGVADAIGGVVKRALDRKISYGKDIANASDVYITLHSRVKAVKVFFVSEVIISNTRLLIPSDLKTVKGTMKIHQVISKPEQ